MTSPKLHQQLSSYFRKEKGYSRKQAYAAATKRLQNAGYLKPGTLKRTKKDAFGYMDYIKNNDT